MCKLELRLREPQADDALAEIRHHRRVIQGLWQFKRLNVSGMGNRPNTRMLNLYKRFNGKTERAAAKYRSARIALDVLDPGGLWSKQIRRISVGLEGIQMILQQQTVRMSLRGFGWCQGPALPRWMKMSSMRTCRWNG